MPDRAPRTPIRQSILATDNGGRDAQSLVHPVEAPLTRPLRLPHQAGVGSSTASNAVVATVVSDTQVTAATTMSPTAIGSEEDM